MGTSRFTAWAQEVEASPVQAADTAQPSLTCHLEHSSGIHPQKVLASASREINSSISTTVPQYIKEAENDYKIKFLEELRPKFAERRALSPRAPHTLQEHASKKCCSFLLLNKSRVPKCCNMDGSFWSNSAGVSSSLLPLKTWKKLACSRPTLQPSPSTGGNSPGTTRRASGNQKKLQRKGRRAAELFWTDRERQAAMDYVSQAWGLFGHLLLAVSLGCPQKPSHQCPRSPSAPVSQLSNTIPLIACRNQCDETHHSPTKRSNWAQGCSEKAVFFYYQINFKKTHPFHFPHQRS